MTKPIKPIIVAPTVAEMVAADSGQRSCTRCGAAYVSMHTCAHPLHAAVDGQCVYHDPDLQAQDNAMKCDICGPIRMLMTDTGPQ